MDPPSNAASGPLGPDFLTFEALYDELHALAHRQIRRARPGETLRTTALLHEAYLKLARGASVKDRAHFFALAARAMRQVLVDHARHSAALKRGGGFQVATLGDVASEVEADAAELIAIDTALEKLQGANQRMARVVELRFFGGLSVEETAETLDESTATVKRDWRAARAFLLATLSPLPP
jgi:RNA polymerase sigma factor (TIGR02999 family)